MQPNRLETYISTEVLLKSEYKTDNGIFWETSKFLFGIDVSMW